MNNSALNSTLGTFSNAEGTRGWVSQSKDRGTLDIVVLCAITVFLCLWTSVCVNVPAPEHGMWSIFRDRWHMFCLGLLGPEFTLLLAVGQYCSARASVKLFSVSRLTGWTMKHSFLADMGGIHLQVPDVKTFPITAKQLHFLVTNNYIPYPEITTTAINDKNKSDGLARFIATVQMFWFTLSTVSRPIKGYATTTLEIITLAYTFCALATIFFWRHKPMDVQHPFILPCEYRLDRIIDRNGRSAAEHYHFTPLDFVSRQEWIGSKLWVYYVNLLRKLKVIHVYQKPLPIRHVTSFNFMPPDRPFLILMLLMSAAYSAIFVTAWNLHLPTEMERLLWRLCSAGTMGIVLLGGAFEIVGILLEMHRKRPFVPDSDSENQVHVVPAPVRSHPLIKEPSTRFEAILQNCKNKTPDKDPHYDIPIRSLLITTPLCALYCVFRAFVLVEDLISFRDLPASTFMAIEWSTYVPHM